MTGDVKAQFTFPTVTPRQSDTWVKSYRYLRLTMVGLLLALAAAVVYQTYRQGFFLASVSAYYYSPAQAVFVGALIGTGACMIALEGTNVVESQSSPHRAAMTMKLQSEPARRRLIRSSPGELRPIRTALRS
jgi:hypothetical protein